LIYRDRGKLTIIELQEHEEKLSLEKLKAVLLKKPSNIIYCEKGGILYGVISTVDMIKANNAEQNEISVNTRFMSINIGEKAKAKRTFFYSKNIHSLPVLDTYSCLIGDWSRWNSLEVVQNNFNRCEQSIWFHDGCKLAFIYPCDDFREKQEAYEIYCNKLEAFGIKVWKIKCDELLKYVDSMDWILTIDDDEYLTYTAIYCHFMNIKDLWGKLQPISKMNYITNQELVESYLLEIQQKGISVLNLTFKDNEYFSKLQKRINKKFAVAGLDVSNGLRPVMYHDFFDDLGDDSYIDKIMNINFSVISNNGQVVLKDCNSQVYNVSNGERNTISQPEQYDKTIYFIGPCFIYGHYVEDKNTIESFLQEKINAAGYKVKVVNDGCPIYSYNIEFMRARIMELKIKKGDIIVVYLLGRSCNGIRELNLNHILEKYDISEKWMVEHPAHCNHKINFVYAEAIYTALQTDLHKAVKGQGELIGQNRDIITTLYLDRYFSDFNAFDYSRMGSIVMNCNPFTYGHRYLIEQALKKVDYLIIFVVEEDKSVFSFTERFVMVCEGVADLENVKVVPSGPFILSRTTFPEYFIKIRDEELEQNVENDITLFAEKIAPRLNIRYRFVGEEPEDDVTNEYNNAMKRILPQNGVELIEIPRKMQNRKVISASKVREILEHDTIRGLCELIPETTLQILFDEYRKEI
jgi:[citrate (pro-3S)-lyase] ligase